jgi:hypothetical protein
MTERQFDVFIEAVHLGDGAKQLNTDGWTRRSYHICFGKKERAEKIQILAILNGYRANLSFQHAQNAIWVLHLKKQSFSRVGGHSGDRPSWQAEGYKPESCWCVENEIGTLITRRNGKVAIVGNCQMIGRGARIAAGKTECLLMDFLYQASKKLVCRPAHLVAKTQEEAEQITELTQDAAGLTAELVAELDLVGLVETATSQREEALRKRLEENKNKQAKTVSAEEFAMQYHSMETAEFEPTMKWESDAITEKQTKWLSKAHIDLSTIRGKGHASKLLSLYFAHKPINMASYAQRKIMAQMGHPDAWHATAAEARQFFADLNKPKEAVLL